MSLSISQSTTAMGPLLTTGFLGVGGTPPYAYSLLAGGPGGSINPVTGLYTAPATVPVNPAQSYETIQVTDALAATATAQVLIGSHIQLFCDIIQNQMGIANDHIYLWDQKIFQPTDSNLYVAVAVMSEKVFGNTTQGVPPNSLQYCNVMAVMSIDAISRGPAARDQKEQIVMALQSDYAQRQMEMNSFSIGRLPVGFTNISNLDGAAIPYRYNISVNMQYTVPRTVSIPYLDTFAQPTVYINP